MISIEQITFLNEIGQRPQLEDSIYPAPGKATLSDKLFLVCDGVGGENMGEEASRIACEEFASFFEHNPPARGPLTEDYIRESQIHVLRQMGRFAEEHPDAQKMSTTLTLVYLNGNSISVAWCGDSRVYHLRGGEVLWRSADHSLVENLVRHGEITEEEARRHPQRNIITRGMSASGSPSDIDSYIIRDIQDGDDMMLCTDGVLEQIDEKRLKQVVLSNNKNKRSLFMEYCEGVTKDNFSLYFLKLNNDQTAGIAQNSRKLVIPILVSVVMVSLLAALFHDKIKTMFSPLKQDTTIVIPRKLPSAKPETAQPVKKGNTKSTAATPGAAPLPEHKNDEGIQQKEDTGKGLKITITGKRTKIKALITKEKQITTEGNKKIPAVDSTKTDVAPPQNLD